MSGPMVEVRKTPTEACQSQRSSSIDPGFDTANLYLFALDPPRDGFSAEEASTVFERLPRVLRQIGNIEAVTMAARPPFSGLAVAPNSRVRVAGEFDGTAQYAVLQQQVGLGYFSTLDIALLQGREFRENDQRTQAGDLPTPREISVVLNEASDRGGHCEPELPRGSRAPPPVRRAAAPGLTPVSFMAQFFRRELRHSTLSGSVGEHP